MDEKRLQASRPRFCPNCGIGGHGISAFGDGAVLMGNDEEGFSWDCHCKECDWSGDISPDEVNP